MEDEDLGALLARATRRVIEEERPLLAEHGLSMWAYIVISSLARAAAQTQLALAQSIGYDKTRLITLLDALEAEGLLSRVPDPEDRRARIVTLTRDGRARHAAARRSIQRMERRLLADLEPAERATLRRALAELAAGAP
jgi:DNA-binding MarR family transcriptional regulator